MVEEAIVPFYSMGLGALVGGGNKEKTPFPYGFIPVIL